MLPARLQTRLRPDDIFVTSKHRAITWCTEWSKENRSVTRRETRNVESSPKANKKLPESIVQPPRSICTVKMAKSTGRNVSPPGSPKLGVDEPGSRLDYNPNENAVYSPKKCTLDMKRSVGRETPKANGVALADNVGLPDPPAKPRRHSPVPNIGKMTGRDSGLNWSTMPSFASERSSNVSYNSVERRVVGGKWNSGAREIQLRYATDAPDTAYDVHYGLMDLPPKGAVHFDRQPTRAQAEARQGRHRSLTRDLDFVVPRDQWSTSKTMLLGGRMAHEHDVGRLLVNCDAQLSRLHATMRQTERNRFNLSETKRLSPHRKIPGLARKSVTQEPTVSISTHSSALPSPTAPASTHLAQLLQPSAAKASPTSNSSAFLTPEYAPSSINEPKRKPNKSPKPQADVSGPSHF